ncbi:MAG: hypothetical protein HYZ16_11485 [Bacteroidetes bacterium]|jgi:hypothetical protein|nr:hypothetical protein [Bacteroidota bacterium]
MSSLLINPFERWSEGRLLLVGSLGLALGSLMGYWFHVRWDGVIDMHAVRQLDWWQPWADNLINVSSLSICLYVSGLMINKKTRYIDILAAVLVARIALYITSVSNSTGFLVRFGEQVLASLTQGGSPAINDLPIAGAIALILFVMGLMVWHFALLYQGFRVASNAKGATSVMAFISAVVVAELVAKLILFLLP